MDLDARELAPHVLFIEAPLYTFPYSNCIYVEDDTRLVIDPAVRQEVLEPLREKRLDLVLGSHPHVDHALRNFRFPEARLLLHPADHLMASSHQGFQKAFGTEGFGTDFTKIAEFMRRGFVFRPADGPLADGQVIDTGHVEVVVVALPGHTPGHCGFLFPKYGILYASDIDLAKFGPWYGNPGSNIADFLESIERVKSLEPEVLVTSHSGPPFSGGLAEKLDAYRDVVFERNERILRILHSGRDTIDAIVGEHPIYWKYPAPNYWYWEWFMVRNHLIWLEANGAVNREGDRYHPSSALDL